MEKDFGYGRSDYIPIDIPMLPASGRPIGRPIDIARATDGGAGDW